MKLGGSLVSSFEIKVSAFCEVFVHRIVGISYGLGYLHRAETLRVTPDSSALLDDAGSLSRTNLERQ